MSVRTALLLASILMFAPMASAAEKPETVDVWPGRAPGEKGDIALEALMPPRVGEQPPVQRLTNVTRPTLTVYQPDKANSTGAAVVICPGGGYSILAINKEGEEVAAWLNSIGVTGIVLKYRVPKRADDPEHVLPLEDAQRAISLVRSKAGQWGIDPRRIGILGFSAGGHLAANASANFDRRRYDPIDEVDHVSCRPDFAVLCYPAYLLDGDRLAASIPVTAKTPPCFFVHANDDRISAEGSARMFLALKHAGVPAELHIFAKGGHGFGLRPSEFPCSGWPRLCEQWMKSLGLLNSMVNTPQR